MWPKHPTLALTTSLLPWAICIAFLITPTLTSLFANVSFAVLSFDGARPTKTHLSCVLFSIHTSGVGSLTPRTPHSVQLRFLPSLNGFSSVFFNRNLNVACLKGFLRTITGPMNFQQKIGIWSDTWKCTRRRQVQNFRIGFKQTHIVFATIKDKDVDLLALWSALPFPGIANTGQHQLTCLAKLLLSVVANSAGAERLFSLMGNIHTKR
jgi:hypothetical protein